MIDLRRWQRACLLIGGAVILATVLSVVGARALGASDECQYTVQPNDWLSRIATDHGFDSWQALWAMNPQVADPNRIYPGDRLIVCEAGTPSQAVTSPVLVPRHAQAWADHVVSTRPEWADRGDVMFLVAVSQFESTWCENLWNGRDAGWENGTEYLGSYGCVQIRVTASGRPAHRNVERLRGNMAAQAEAAWTVASLRRDAGRSWRSAWGPWQRKLATDCTTVPSRWRDDCAHAWFIADTVTPDVL